MKTIFFKKTKSALFNLDSMRTKLLNERDEVREKSIKELKNNKELSRKLNNEAEALQVKIYEIKDLLRKMHFGCVTLKEWERIQEIVTERQMHRRKILH